MSNETAAVIGAMAGAVGATVAGFYYDFRAGGAYDRLYDLGRKHAGEIKNDLQAAYRLGVEDGRRMSVVEGDEWKHA